MTGSYFLTFNRRTICLEKKDLTAYSNDWQLIPFASQPTICRCVFQETVVTLLLWYIVASDGRFRSCVYELILDLWRNEYLRIISLDLPDINITDHQDLLTDIQLWSSILGGKNDFRCSLVLFERYACMTVFLWFCFVSSFFSFLKAIW